MLREKIEDFKIRVEEFQNSVDEFLDDIIQHVYGVDSNCEEVEEEDSIPAIPQEVADAFMDIRNELMAKYPGADVKLQVLSTDF